MFQLTHFPSLITDLELTPESYLDAYNVTSGYWEQHMVTTVRTIESEQRLLYKVRKSLLSGLADDVCRGFSEELDLQSRRNQHASGNTTIPPTSTSQLKRPLSAGAEIPSTKRLFVPESYPPHPMCIPSIGYMIPSQTVPYTAPLASPPIVGPSQVRNEDGAKPNTPTGGSFHGTLNTQTPIISQTPLFTSNTPGISIALPTRLSLPQHSHPPTKRWPNDYIVSEIATGFRAMDAMSAQSSTVTQRMAFERVFNCRYVKSTVCRHRAVYRKADPALRTLFEGMGNNENASWGEFVKRVEGRSVTAEKSKGSEDDNGGLRVDLQGVACQQNPSLSSDTRADPGAHQILASMDQPRIDIPPGKLLLFKACGSHADTRVLTDPLLSEETGTHGQARKNTRAANPFTGAATFTPSVHEGATVD